VKITKNQLRRIIREEKQKLLAENRVRNAVRAALNEQTEFSSQSLRWITDEVLPPMAQWAEYGLDTSYPLVQAANALKVNVRTGNELALIDTEGDTDADYEMLAGMDLPVIKQLGRQMSLVRLPDGVEAVMLNDRGTGMIVARSADVGR
jgi:hypothetical protein